MFDHLIWWQVLVLLCPVVGITYFIRFLEQLRTITPYKALTPQQKAWLLLTAMPPGVSAKIQMQMEPQERDSYLGEGQSILGHGHRLVDPVVKEFESFYDKKDRPATEGYAVDRLSHLVKQSPPSNILEVIRRHWPAGKNPTLTATAQPAIDLPA